MPRLIILGAVYCLRSVRQMKALLAPLDREDDAWALVAVNGNGILTAGGDAHAQIRMLFDSGIDIVILGDQAIARASARALLDQDLPIIRPLNFPLAAPGEGAWRFHSPYGDLWVVSLFTGTMRLPVDDAGQVLERFLEGRTDAWAVLVEIYGPDVPLKQALAWKFRRHKPCVHIVGAGLGVGTIDAGLTQQRAFVADVGTILPQGSVLGQCPESWLQQRYERSPRVVQLANSPLEGTAIEVILDPSGAASRVRRIALSEGAAQ